MTHVTDTDFIILGGYDNSLEWNNRTYSVNVQQSRITEHIRATGAVPAGGSPSISL